MLLHEAILIDCIAIAIVDVARHWVILIVWHHRKLKRTIRRRYMP